MDSLSSNSTNGACCFQSRNITVENRLFETNTDPFPAIKDIFVSLCCYCVFVTLPEVVLAVGQHSGFGKNMLFVNPVQLWELPSHVIQKWVYHNWGEPERAPHLRDCIAHVRVYVCLLACLLLACLLACGHIP